MEQDGKSEYSDLGGTLSRDLLSTHGYISRMIGAMHAPRYFTHLLQFNERDIQLVASNDTSGAAAFLLIHPAVQNVQPITYIDNRPAWLLDYMVRDIGTVVPQSLWSPAATPTVPLHVPIFFVQRDQRTIGLPLSLAAAGDCSSLLDRHLPAPVGGHHTINIHIMWPGQHEWSSQIMTRDQTPLHNTITMEGLAARVARAVGRFLQDRAVEQQGTSYDWRIGQGGTTDYNILLVGLINVSQGSWQPILQLNRFVGASSSSSSMG